jgi:hypothetical protein
MSGWSQRQKILLIRGHDAHHALTNPCQVTLQGLLSPFRRRSFLRNFQSAIEFFVDEVRVLQLSDDLRPNNLIEKILTNWSTVANCTFEMTPSVSTETPVVMDPACQLI